ATDRAFDAEAWRKLQMPSVVPHGSNIVLGFDGSRTRDATAIVATEVVTGYQWVLGLWQRPPDIDGWEVPADEVNVVIADAFRDYRVWRVNADPPYWETTIREWAGRYGKERIVEFWTSSPRRIGPAVRAFAGAIAAGEISHSGDLRLASHVGNAIRKPLPVSDDEGHPLWAIQKERSDSPHKIDAAMAAILSWEARTQALATGIGRPPKKYVGAFLA
ncbi:MAG: phage terminase family protein, partial [Cyanobacteria bacterium REEB65]|nr:phage terminase family protein [Cyanobacteria bacterium REEB65]